MRRYDIDPILGTENLVWAPMRVSGQHGLDALQYAVNMLKNDEAAGASRAEIVDILNQLGEIAARRR